MKFDNSPLVSVVVPVFNGERYIQEAIESVYSQTYSNLEIIVVDDGSTDSSATKLAKFKSITYKQQNNSGPAVARNLGVQLARGEYIAFLDQDDVWMPRKLEEQVACFSEAPNFGLVSCCQRTILDGNQSNVPLSVFMHLKMKNSHDVVSACPSAMMIRRSVLDMMGGFNENYPFYSEADLILRLKASQYLCWVSPKTLLLKRFHENNLSYRTNITQRELLSIVRDSLKRKSIAS